MTAPFGVNILAQTVRDRTALLNWLTAAQSACVVCMDDSALTQQIRKALPNSIVISRTYNPNDSRWEQVTTPQEWLAAHLPFAANGVYLQVFNEPAPTNLEPFLSFLETLCAICPPAVRLAFPHFAVGNPHEDDILRGKYDRLLRLVCGTRHVLALHEYLINDPAAEQPFLCGRFTYWQRRARVLGLPEPTICITEHGRDVGGGVNDGWQGAGWSEQDYFQRLVEAQHAVYDNAMPVAVFCWGTGAANRWRSFDIQDAPTLQKLLIDWNKTHTIQEKPPVPTPTPPTPIGAPIPMRVTTSAGLKLRTAPDTNAAVVRLMPFGEAVTAYPDNAHANDGYRWIVVTDTQGNTGWAADVYLQKVVQPPTPVEPFRLTNPVGCAHIISSKFGTPRDYDGDGVFDDIHEGLDITRAHPDCTPLILNGHAGVVSEVSNAGAYGKHVLVKSIVGGVTYTVWYCHLDRIFVAPTVVLSAGDAVGVMGSTGNSTGVHLHINVQKEGAPTPAGSPVPNVIDPLPLIDWG